MVGDGMTDCEASPPAVSYIPAGLPAPLLFIYSIGSVYRIWRKCATTKSEGPSSMVYTWFPTVD